ncbi:MAG TPA: 7-carboxy-7-deazaguanine synthase QueE [Candidatus Sulfotelmatobacter sp.]|nr:7-carboxy-7-deazaguanine synthase QueE [Candidatus Sulfotelmatobacter sp.]
MTSYRISELFLSLQGEGPSAGSPAHFLRLQGCDVGCQWCDSKYTWDAAGGRERTLDQIWAEMDALGRSELLVITGGEPLEHPNLAELLDQACARWARVEVETSGVLPPPRSLANLFYNVSPKLTSATPRAALTWAHVDTWRDEPRATFKLVVGDPPDVDEALRLIREHDLPRQRVMLMPEGLTDASLRERAVALAEVCKHEGLRLSPRLHIWMWGAKRGV